MDGTYHIIAYKMVTEGIIHMVCVLAKERIQYDFTLVIKRCAETAREQNCACNIHAVICTSTLV